MIEQDVKFKSGNITLSGTLAMPNGDIPFPAIVFIAGSGEVDRNENHRKMPINVFKELTEHLTGHGFATLRYDKRGVGESEGHYLSTGFFDNIQDAKWALEYLKSRNEIDTDHIFIIGHSEGAYAAIKIASEGTGLAGIVLIAGGARKGEEELKWQARQVVSNMKGFQKWLIDVLHVDPFKSQQKLIDKIYKSDKDWFRLQIFNKINAKWMREFLNYDPSVDLPKIEVPVFAIIGSQDIQVDPSNLETMALLIKSPFKKYLVPRMTHLLREEESKRGLSGYKQQLKKPVDPRITSSVIKWLNTKIPA